MKKASGTQVIYCDFAAMANLPGCVLLVIIFAKGEKNPKKVPDLVIKKFFLNEAISSYLTVVSSTSHLILEKHQNKFMSRVMWMFIN